MDEERLHSRTEEGRKKLLGDADALFSRLAELLDESKHGDKDADQGVAVLANLFSDDGSKGTVLSLCIQNGHLLRKVVQRISQQRNFVSATVCVCNAWKQSLSHQRTLLDYQVVPALLACASNEKLAFQVLACLGTLVDSQYKTDSDQPPTPVPVGVAHLQGLSADLEPLFPAQPQLVVQFAKLLLGNDDMTTTIVNTESGCKWLRDELGRLLEMLDDENKLTVLSLLTTRAKALQQSDMSSHLFLPNSSSSSLFQVYRQVLSTQSTDSPNVPILLQGINSMSMSEAVCEELFRSQLEDEIISLCAKSTEQIPYQIALRITDQSLLLPHATTRLHALETLLKLCTSETRCRFLLRKPGLPSLFFAISRNYCDYDYEATRLAISILKNLALADSTLVTTQCGGCITEFVSHVLRSSQDQNTVYIASGIFRTCCSRAGRTSREAFCELMRSDTNSSNSYLVQIMSIDLVKTHPHTRVELARAIANLMEAMGAFRTAGDDVNTSALETLQAIKFVSFLLQAPSAELRLEAVDAILGLPDGLLDMLSSHEVEIVPGTMLVGKLKDIWEESKDVVDSIPTVNVSRKSEVLLRKLGVSLTN